jgi:hypothetical protein
MRSTRDDAAGFERQLDELLAQLHAREVIFACEMRG